MTNQASHTNKLSLQNFFIFNSTYGPKEGEEERKIMFYYPDETHIETKIKHIGLAEAIIQFVSTFADSSCRSLHTQKSRQLFFQPEKDFWMVMTIALPFKEKTKEGQVYVEYREDDVQDSVFEAVLQLAYKMFKLFNGALYHNIERYGDIEWVKKRLENFYFRYLLTINLSKCDILDVFSGIHYQPLEKNMHLQVQCLINRLELSAFPLIKYTLFLYNDKLVWSGLRLEDTRTLFHYLVASLLPNHLAMEHQADSGLAKPHAVGVSPFCKFITGPADISDQLPLVFLDTDTANEQFCLLAYGAMSATVCMLISGDSQLSVSVCRNIDNTLGHLLPRLASDIKEAQFQRVAPSSCDPALFKYIYFNHMNLAQQTTVHVDPPKNAGSTAPQEVVRLIADINCDFTRNEHDGETILRTKSDHWVFGRKSESREFYVIVNQKGSSLVDVHEQVRWLCSTYLNSIFFLE